MARKPDLSTEELDRLLEKAGLDPRVVDPDRPDTEPYPDELEDDEGETEGEEEEEGGETPPEREGWEQKVEQFLASPRTPAPEPGEPPPSASAPDGSGKAPPSAGAVLGAVGRLQRHIPLLSPERPIGALANRFGNLPTPGGLTPWIAVLLALWFALEPANGNATRLELIWRGLTRGAHVPGDALAQQLAREWSAATDNSQLNVVQEAELKLAQGLGFWGLLPGITPGGGAGVGSGAAQPAEPASLLNHHASSSGS